MNEVCLFPRTPRIEIIPPTCDDFKKETRAYVVVFSGTAGRSKPSYPTECVTIDPMRRGQVLLTKIPQDNRYEKIEIYRTHMSDGRSCFRMVAAVKMGARMWKDNSRTVGQELIY